MPKLLITKPDDPARPYLSHQVEQMRNQLTTMQFKFDQDTISFSALALAVAALDLACNIVFDESDSFRCHVNGRMSNLTFALAWLKGRLGGAEVEPAKMNPEEIAHA